MDFIIESSKKIKGKFYKDYFLERLGCMNVMVCNPAKAKIYHSKKEADTDRRKFFGERLAVKTITYVQDTNNNVPGSVRQGHDSGIF